MATISKNNVDRTLLIVLMAIISIGIFLLRFFDKGCLPEHDCETYIAMAHSIAPASLVPHHAVRILPPLLARGLHGLGLSIHDSFLVIVTCSVLATFYLLYRLCLEVSQNPILSFTASLALFVWHWGMLIPLKTPYQACDAMVYLFVMATIYCIKGKHLWPLFFISFLGILTGQSCFVLAFFSTLQLFWMIRRPLILIHLLLLIATYAILTHIYHSEQVLAKLLTPSADLLSWKFVSYFISDSHVLFVLLPFIPWLIVGWRDLCAAFRKHWYLLCYGLVVSIQPAAAYNLVGYHNFVRLALQGIWGIALVLLLHAIQKPLSSRQTIGLLSYTILLSAIWDDQWRLVVTALISIWLLFPWPLTSSSLLCKSTK